jgi:hypothetical protein
MKGALSRSSKQKRSDVFAAVGSRLICLHDSGDDVEYGISVLAFTVDFFAFVESDNRRENSQSRPFFCAEELTHFPR